MWVWGTGPPLILVAGQGATLQFWTPDLLRLLAQGREVIIFDSMGVGMSTYSGIDYSLAHFAETTVDFLEALDLERPDVLGWSFGGAITLNTAVAYAPFRRIVLTVGAVTAYTSLSGTVAP